MNYCRKSALALKLLIIHFIKQTIVSETLTYYIATEVGFWHPVSVSYCTYIKVDHFLL